METQLQTLLKDKSLLRQAALINGQWREEKAEKRIEVRNPATMETVGFVPDCGATQTREAIEAAHAAFADWSGRTALERGTILLEWERVALENLDDLAKILTVEEGKPLAEAKGEIRQGLSYLPWFAAEARRVFGQTAPPARHGIQAITRYAPLGVAAAITPWNFPFSMLPRKLAPALACGCCAVVKPASRTPFSALALCELGMRAGLPAGTLNAVTGNAAPIADELTANPLVRKLSFTGSTRIGKKLAEQCAPTLKRVSLELGGNAPFLVFADADLDQATALAIACKFRNAGQTCICANRILVHKDIYEDFAHRLTAAASALRLGNGLDPATEMGPMITPEARERVAGLVADAVENGAKLLCGGKGAHQGPCYYEPTVLADIKPSMRIWKEEIFGPVAAVASFTTDDEAIALANDTNFGLASYACTQNMPRIWKLFEKLQYGMLGINDITLASAETPFGGVKDSGTGREGGTEAILEYMEAHYMLLGGLE